MNNKWSGYTFVRKGTVVTVPNERSVIRYTEKQPEFEGIAESTDLEEALSPKDFVNGGDEKITQREVDSMLSMLFGNIKMLKSLEANKAYKDGYAGKTKNPYKKDTADYHLFILGQQSADADA